ncbi:hypothetical protein [Micropruina sp.]|uniref:hypothetical protein n=1 Tax=Micropruina sp. TaxID=2737536 RepID=UPI0039E505AB
MDAEPHTIPRVAVHSTAGGLLLMAFFTTLWASWTLAGLPLPAGFVVVAAFLVCVVLFVVEGIRLFVLARRFPTVDTVERRGQTRSMGRRFGVIFGLEGVLIGVASGVLGATGLSDYLNPVIALIVGLHFIPLAGVFERTIDYWIAGWVIAAALVGIGLLTFTTLAATTVWTIVALATACGTSTYGFYMICQGRRIAINAG